MNKHHTALELDKVLSRLGEFTSCEDAREQAENLIPESNMSLVQALINQTADAHMLMAKFGAPSFGGLKNVNNALSRANAGSVLNMRELLDIAEVLRVIRSLSQWKERNSGVTTSIDTLFYTLSPNKFLEDKITSAIISEEEMSDNASPELYNIRRKIRAASSKVRDHLDKMTKSQHYQKYLRDSIVTMRGGRYVVPVKIEHKGEISGLVHDTSSSGATVFIEPAAVVEANNEIKVLQGKERDEMERILCELSVEAGGFYEGIKASYECAVELNIIFAKAKLAYEMKATVPTLNDEGIINLRKARHPLIDPKKVVATDIMLGKDFDTLVITGPNTGGKTVSIKTLGLLSLMAMCGLMLPVGDRSEISVFDNVLADIGDEQSIEQSLSTFSAHMVNIVSMLDSVTDRSLVLFDELGAGTDPVEGAALAVALLEHIREKGAFCAATTHYAELKAFALETDGVVNASCEFDIETLKPTYKLVIGTPGKSNAFAISGKLGLDKHIIERASALVNSDDKRFEYVIEKLEHTRIESEKYREELKRSKEEFDAYRTSSEKQIRQELEKAKAESERAQEKARQTIEGARASVEFVLAEIEKLRKRKAAEMSAEELLEAKRRMRRSLDESDSKYNSIEDYSEQEEYVLPRALVKGDNVKLRNIGKAGVLIDNPDKDGNCRVKVGGITTRTNIKNLKLLSDKDIKKEKNSQSKGSVRKSAASAFSPELDIRGQLGEDGWYLTDKYIDDAIIAGIKTVHIIHGKGTGALRNYLWSMFKTDKRLKSFRLGRYGEGDGGVTVIELN